MYLHMKYYKLTGNNAQVKRYDIYLNIKSPTTSVTFIIKYKSNGTIEYHVNIQIRTNTMAFLNLQVSLQKMETFTYDVLRTLCKFQLTKSRPMYKKRWNVILYICISKSMEGSRNKRPATV